MGDIKRIPEATRDTIRSGVIIYDLPRVVEELIFNSLDAGADKITVAVGVGTCYIKVMDNGCGITRDGLVLLAERYATSKSDADIDVGTQSFGFRGEALSSIANVSLLEVLTKTHGRPNGYRKVMKGCKCLYIGIDDGRQDVGTTVIVRDLFYNQPVRRKQIQSSTKKVLLSVKKCVLRISLVHPKVCFKVVDIESDDELFCATTSSTPLSRLMSGFGAEIANGLHEVNVTDGVLKLSGYMSSPCDISAVKALQYIYINSRYIGKGTIHKLLNQLATSFYSLQHQKINVGFQTAKRNRTRTFSTFILNLNCPRSLYTFTFEPSKTSVDFKDWKPIISFIEKAITRIWSEVLPSDVVADGNDVPGDNVLKEAGQTYSQGGDFPAKCGNAKRKGRVQNYIAPASPSSHLEMQIEEHDHFNHLKRNKISRQNFLYRSDSSFKSFEESLTLSRVPVDRDNWSADYSVFPTEDQLMGNTYFEADKYREQADYIPDFGFDDDRRNVETSSKNEYLDSDLPKDPFEIGNVGNVRKEFEKPWLHSCSSRKRRVTSEYSESNLLIDPLEIGFVGNMSKDFEKPFLQSCTSRKKPVTSECAESGFPTDPFEIGNEGNMSKDFEKPFLQSCTSWRKSVTSEYSESDLPTDPFEIGNVGNINKDFEKAFMQSCTSRKRQAVNDFLESDLPSDPFEISNNGIESNDFENHLLHSCTSRKRRLLDDVESLARSGGVNFPIESSRSKATCSMLPELNFFPKNSANASLEGRDLDRENNLLLDSDTGLVTKFHGCKEKKYLEEYMTSTKYDFFEDRESKDHNFHFDDSIWNTSSRQHFSSFSGRDIPSELNSYAPIDEDNFGIPTKHNLFDVRFPRSSDIFNDEAKWLSSDLCHNYDDKCGAVTFHHIPSSFCLDGNKDQKVLKVYAWKKRPRRSHSAPPFYGDRKKFSSLNTHLTMEAEKGKNKNSEYPGASELKHTKGSSGAGPPDSKSKATEIILANSRKDMEGPDTGGIQKVKMKEKSEGLQFNNIQDPSVSELKWRRGYLKTTNGDKSHNLQNEDTILDVSSGLLHLAGDSLVPESNNRNLLKDAKVLQQVDKKFIPVVGTGVLAIIDQHAADERIRLEELRKKVLAGERKTITYLDTEQKLVMPEIGYQLLHTYAEQIQNWGWLCNFHSQDSISFKRNLTILHKQPASLTLVAVPCVLGVNLTDVDLLEFLQQLADTDGSSTIPPSVHRVLNSKACRGAIMFGDSLLHSECSLIVEELKQTSLCFQCAHGRPTTVPLVNLDALHKQIEKLGLWNESSHVWHGLKRHVPSLERAKSRLRASE